VMAMGAVRLGLRGDVRLTKPRENSPIWKQMA
jgi:hypothetical protein